MVKHINGKKKILVTTILILLLASLLNISCISSGIQVIPNKTYSFSFTSPSIQNVFTTYGSFSTISLNETQNNNQPGQPALPCTTKTIMLPVGKTVDDITVNAHLKASYNITYPIIPEQKMVSNSDDNFSFCYNISDYQKTLEFSNLVTTDVQYMRGYPLLSIDMRPINYNPSQNKLFYYDEIMLTVSFKDAPVSSFYRGLEKDQEYMKTVVDNPDDYGYMPMDGNITYLGGLCDPSQKYDYVIITNESLNSAWQPLIDQRINYSHLNCTIVTVENIDACPDYWNATSLFNDTQAHIREFCKDAYLDWNTDYILLGGDWRDGIPSEQIIPYRLFTDRFETLTYNTMPCDMYYSNLDGNWYYNGSGGMWGGGVDSGVNDKYAELFVGRITAYNDTMVQNAINKIIWYDNCNDTSWLNKTSFWGGNLGWTVTSKQYMEELRLGTDTYRTFTGFEEWNTNNPNMTLNTTERLYHADLGSNYKDYWDASIQNDNFSIVNHIDHSDYNSPFGLPNWQYRINTKPFFGYTQGCLAGRYNIGYAGCEQMICRYPDRNAFALILNTGYGYGSEIDTDGPSQSLNCYFWDYFFNSTANNTDSWQIGRAQTYSKDKMSPMVDGGTDHAWCYNWYSTQLFGDPAQTLKITYNTTAENNTTENITYPLWDINQDGNVSYLDLSLIVTYYGENGTLGWIPEDINTDGVINYLDLSLLVLHYGESY